MSSPYILIILFFICFLLVVNGRRLYFPDESEEHEHESNPIPYSKSVCDFVKLVDELNLNVSIIGSYRENGEDNVLSIKWQMPVDNVETPTQVTLDIAKQKHFLNTMKKYMRKAARTTVTVIEDGKEKTVKEQVINPDNLIDLVSYDHLVKNVNGEVTLNIPSNESYTTVFNYVLSNTSSDGAKNIQMVASTIWVKEVDISNDFPADVLEEIKKSLPKLYASTDDMTVFARSIVLKLNKTFDINFDVLVDVENVAFGLKPFAKLNVGTSNVLFIVG